MRAEDLLREPERLDRKIRILAREIDRIRLGLLPGGIDYTLDRVDGGGGSDRYPAALDRILPREEKIRELNARRLWLLDVRIPWLLSQIRDDLDRDIVRAYYCEGRNTMEQVAELVHVSYATAYRHRDRGVGDVQKILDAEE